MKIKIIFSSIIISILGACSVPLSVFAQEDTVMPPLLDVIRIGLENNYGLKIGQQELNTSIGKEQAYSGAFSPLFGVDVDAMWGINPSVSYDNPQSADAYLFLPTKFGVDFQVGVAYGRQYDLSTRNADGSPVSEYYNGAFIGFNTPLLRGFGLNNSNYLKSQSAKLEREAAKINFDYEVMSYICDIGKAYIQYYFSLCSYYIQDSILDDFGKLIKSMQLKIDNKVMPEASILPLQARQKQLESELASYRILSYSKYYELQTLMGVSKTLQHFPKLLAKTLQLNISDFEQVVVSVFPNIDEIVENNMLIQVQTAKLRMAEVERNLANNERYSDLNLGFKVNYYSFMTEQKWNTFLTYPDSHYPGASYNLTLSYKLPLLNDVAAGNFMIKDAQYQISKEVYEQIQMQLKHNLQTIISALSNQSQIYKMNLEVNQLKSKVLENANLTYSLGTTSILDLITAHEDYVATFHNLYQSEMQMAGYWLDFLLLSNKMPNSSDKLSNWEQQYWR
ncbi:MAG: TolC family protein [Ignavibacteria bacterium]|jgi:outer membrane protein TolC|nr:TolC family protein [Ignavibacteria bacterium]